MAAFLGTMASFICLCALCAFLARHTKMPAGLAPLPVCCGAMVWLVLGGYLGLLRPAAIVLLCSGVAALLFMAVTWKKGGFRRLLTPGFILFFLVGTGFITLFAVRQPVAQGWDEFSLWATAVKLSREHHVIYSEAPIGWAWTGTQKPGLPTFAYFFNYFGAYAAWRIYAAYGVLSAAVLSAAVGVFSWKHWKLIVPTTLLVLLLPYFGVYQRDIYCNFTYLSAYADIPMGVLCAGMLAWYFHAVSLRRQNAQSPLFCTKSACALWPLALISAAIVLCKDTGLPLAMLVAGMIVIDLLFAGGEAKPFAPKVWLPKLGLGTFMVGSAGGMFVASSRYISSLGVATGSVSSTGDGSAIGNVEMLVEGTKMLLGFAPSEKMAAYAEKFAAIKAEMISLFLPGEFHNITMVGCGLFVLIFVWLMLGAAALLTQDKLHRRTSLLYGVFSTLGFVAYYVFIGYTYVFVFKQPGITAIQEYNRYFNTYYALWVGGAMVLFVLGAAKGSRMKNLLTLGSITLAPAMLLRFNQLMQPQLCVIDYPDVVYGLPHAVHARAEAAKEKLPENSRVYYVNSGDDGYGWFRYSYEFVPQMLVYSHGGGNFMDFTAVETPPENGHLSLAEFAAELSLCEYVYIDQAYPTFWQSYAGLFADGGKAAQNGETLLYKIEKTGPLAYTPVTPQEVGTPEKELDENGKVLPFHAGLPGEVNRQKLDNPLQSITLTPVEMEVPGV